MIPGMPKGKTYDRDPLDNYPTPRKFTKALFGFVEGLDRGGLILEPACGRGDMVTVLVEEFGENRVVARDITTGHDFLQNSDKFPFVITNPPFKLTNEFIQHGLDTATNKLALLLPYYVFLNKGPNANLVKYLEHYVLIMDMMKVETPGGIRKSMFRHAWYVFSKNRTSGPNIHWVTPTKEG